MQLLQISPEGTDDENQIFQTYNVLFRGAILLLCIPFCPKTKNSRGKFRRFSRQKPAEAEWRAPPDKFLALVEFLQNFAWTFTVVLSSSSTRDLCLFLCVCVRAYNAI